jgi:hypothetical protein
MPNAQKKVIVRRLNGEILNGYLPSLNLVRTESGAQWLDLLDLTGHILSLPLLDIKAVSYVRDFNLIDTLNPERLTRRTFLARPRTEGLWLRLTFHSGEILEGLAAADLSLLTNAAEDFGIFLTPPDIRSNTQRVFIPRIAIADLQILAVITTPSRIKPAPQSDAPTQQESLFTTP